MKRTILSAAFAGFSMVGLEGAVMPIDMAGANADLIWESGGTAAPFDIPNTYAYAGNNIFYGGGYGNPGVPESFVSVSNPSMAFSLLGGFSGNNALLMAGGGSGVLTLATPASYSSIHLLTSSAHGSAFGNVTLTFTDAATLTLAYVSPDWFTVSPTGGASTAWSPEIPGGSSVRVNTTTGVSYLTNSAAPYLFSFPLDIPEEFQDRSLESLTFDVAAGGVNLTTAIFGVSGELVAVPEPSTIVLVGAGALGLIGGFRSIRRRSASE